MASAKRKVPFRFLHLPAELRNMIYKLVPDEIDTIKLHRTNIRGLPSLSQTCKQIHAEYGPVYLEHLRKAIHSPTTTVHINWKDVPNFLVTYFSNEEGMSRVPKALSISLQDPEADQKAVGRKYVDILPLLRMRQLHPHFECRFVNEHKIVQPPPRWKVNVAGRLQRTQEKIPDRNSTAHLHLVVLLRYTSSLLSEYDQYDENLALDNNVRYVRVFRWTCRDKTARKDEFIRVLLQTKRRIGLESATTLQLPSFRPGHLNNHVAYLRP